MTPQERLKLYETALIDWTAGLKMTEDEKFDSNVYAGFCAYFKRGIGLSLYGETDFAFAQTLPELFNQKPSKYNLYWFEFGDIKSRITCLENAIKLIKQTYNL